jgi:hypothetical protein
MCPQLAVTITLSECPTVKQSPANPQQKKLAQQIALQA